MKKIIYTFALLFFATLLLAQKNKIGINSQMTPYFDNASKASIGLQYFRQTKIGTFGLKTNYFFSKDKTAEQYIFADIIYRLNLKKNPKRFQWHYDVGFAYLAERRYYRPKTYFYCGTGLSREEMVQLQNLHQTGFWTGDDYYGISNAIGFDYALKKFTFGFEMTANMYYDFDYQDITPYFAPNLSVGYRF